jgi:hypothetical protein
MVLEVIEREDPVPAPDLASLVGVEHPRVASPVWDRPDIAWRSTSTITSA